MRPTGPFLVSLFVDYTKAVVGHVVIRESIIVENFAGFLLFTLLRHPAPVCFTSLAQ